MKSIDRVKKIIEYKELSISAFEKVTGMSNNSIQTAIKKNANLKDITLNVILNTFPDINPEWLLTGKGEMFREGQPSMPIEYSKASPFFQRLTELAEFKGFKSMNDFALNGLGYNSAEKLNRLKKEENKPSCTIITDITNKFVDINPQWLLTGEGSMLKTLPNEDTHKSIEDFILDKIEEKLFSRIEKRLQSKIEELKALINKLSS